jgi:hypothetical protein
MKLKHLLIVLILFCTPGLVHAQYTFRQTRWGMTQAEVRNAENGEPDPKFSKADTLAWRTTIIGEHAFVAYTFAFNKLVRAKYMLATDNPTLQSIFGLPQTCDNWPPEFRSPDKRHLPSCRDMTTNGKFILDFNRFEEALKKRYNAPIKDYKGAPPEANLSGSEEESLAALNLIERTIRLGKLAWYTQWKTKDTNIIFILRGSGGELLYEIGYSSIDLKIDDPPL